MFWRRLFSSLSFLSLVFLASSFSVSSSSAQVLYSPYQPAEVIIRFKEQATQQERNTILHQLGASELRSFQRIDAKLHHITKLSVVDAVMSYSGHSLVEYIEPNYVISQDETPNDPRFSELWGMENTGQTGGSPGADISATNAWDLSTGSSSVLIGVIDSGVDHTHPDLASNIFINTGEIPDNQVDDDNNGFVDDVRGWDFVNNDNDPFDDAGHGTHVAGTIGAVGNNGIGVAGVNWSAKILPIKFLNSSGTGSTAGAISSVEYATLMGVQLTNNSWGGGGFSQALRDAIEDAGDQGILFVAASGNSGVNNDTSPHYPSSYTLDCILSVAATDHNDGLAGFSNYGANSVDLAAPGVNILSTIPGGGYASNQGTSMASPHVAGAGGLIYGRFPGIGALQVKTLILNSVDPIASLAGIVLTGGRLNAFMPIADPDSTRPAAIDDLNVLAQDGSWIDIAWTATGDDSLSGVASRYDVRYATFVIDENNFDTATPANDDPDPGPPGTSEQMRVQDLAFGTTYSIAIRVLDEFGNASALSNVVNATTLGPPTIAASPGSLSADLLTGASETQIVMLTNSGQSELIYDVSFRGTQTVAKARIFTVPARLAPSSESLQAAFAPRSTQPFSLGQTARRAMPLMPKALASTPSLTSGLQVAIFSSGGSPTEIQGLLAAFPNIDNVDILMAGALAPDLDELLAYDVLLVAANNPFPDPGGTGDVLADYADTGGGVIITLAAFVSGFGLQGRFVTEGYMPFEIGGGPLGTSSLGNFDASHPIMAGVSSATGDLLGDTDLSSGAGFVADWTFGEPLVATQGSNVVGVNVFIAENGFWTGDIPLILHNAVLWSSSAFTSWLSASPNPGVVSAGGSLQLSITFDALGLVGGDYNADILVSSNDPITPELTIPSQMHVTGAPDIDVSPTEIDFGDQFVGGMVSDTLVISNLGTDLLMILGASADHSDFSIEPTNFNIAVGSSDTLLVTLAPSAPGPISGTLTLPTNDPDENPLLVPLSGVALIPPVIGVVPDSLSADLFTGESTTQILTISNSGPSPLEFNTSTSLIELQQAAKSGLGSFDKQSKLVRYDAFQDGAALPHSQVTVLPAPVSTGIHQRYQDLLTSNVTVFFDDMESGVNGWTHYATATQDQWAQSTARASSGVVSWNVSQHSGSGADALQSPSIDLTRYDEASLGFQHWYDFDDCNDPEFDPDGGIVEVSTDGGTTWTQIFPIDGYPRVLDDICGNPLAFLDAYTRISGTGAAFVPALFDLSPFVGNIISLRFHAGWDCGNCDSNEGWYIDDVSVFSEGVSWLTLNPAEGTVPSASSVDVEVTVDATGLFGGDYAAEIDVASNDPIDPNVLIPVNLHVTGAPDIALSTSLLEFGEVFLGVMPMDTLAVANVGTDLLSISSIVSDDPLYTVQPTSFDLNPGESTNVFVTFSPVTVGSFPATLTVYSNDPDESTAPVGLSGQGLEPPIVSVSPDSLTEHLFTGETAIQTLSIHNSGGSDLIFQLDVDLAGQSGPRAADRPQVAQKLTAPPRNRRRTPGLPGALRPEFHGELPVDANPVGPLEIVELTFDDDFEDGDYDGWTNGGSGIKEVTSATAAAGSFFSYHESSAPASHFNGIHQTLDTSQPLYMGFWVRSSSTTNFDGYVVLSDRGTDVIWFSMTGDGVLYINANVGGDESVPYSANTWYHIEFRNIDWTAKDFDYYVNGALVKADIPFRSASFVSGITRIDLYSWSQGSEAWWDEIYMSSEPPPDWISADPLAGVVPPGGTLDINVAFDAEGLLGGEYRSNINVSSNDPFQSEIAVPTVLNVTGAPDIEVSDTLLDYDAVFVGVTAVDTIAVSNVGTDVLSVSSIVSDNATYTAQPTSFDLDPGQSINVLVSFAPTSVGAFPATLSINSNDQDELVTEVILSGHGVAPPVASVTPDSLVEHLFTGETSTQRLSIHNFGGSNLIVQLSVDLISQGTMSALPDGLRNDDNRSKSSFRIIAPEQAGLRAARQVEQTTTWRPEEKGEFPGTPGPPGPVELVQSTFADNFEDGDFDGWINAGPGTKEVTNATAAGGSFFSYHELDAPASHFNGIYQTLEPSQPQYAGFWVRSSATADHDAYVVLSSQSTEVIFFFMQGNGLLYVNGVESVPYTAHTWYHIEFRDIDWTAKTFDYYVNGDLIQPGISFRSASTVTEISRIDLYSYTGGSEAWWDEIYVSSEPPPDWLSPNPSTGVIPPGATLDVDVTFDASGLLGGEYRADLVVSSNDPFRPQIPVPAVLHVTGAPDLVTSDSLLAFGEVFIGAVRNDTLVVANQGTDVLNATLVSSEAEYTVSESALSLPPGQSSQIIVSFAPGTVGARPALLTLTSNDPDEPEVQVVLTGAGVEPPIMGIQPSSLVSNLQTGEAEIQVLTLSNSGGSDLEFTLDTHDGASSVAIHQSVSYAKGEEDPRVGEPVASGNGGPDMFGYRWVDSDEPNGPAFNWVDITGVGRTVALSGDDALSQPLPIGFSFPFYGNEFNTLRVCTNGFITFSDDSRQFTNQPLPSPGAPRDLLAAFWDDLTFPTFNAWYYNDGTRFIVEYLSVPRLGSGGPYTFQIILYPSGRIVYQYLTMGSPTTSATIGMQNQARDDGLLVVFNNTYVHDALAIEFTAEPDWLTALPSSGTVPPGGNMPINVVFDATDLVGTYQAVIDVASNAPLQLHTEIPVTLNVTGVPDIAVNPRALIFGHVFVGFPSTLQLDVTSIGTDTLVVTDITIDDPDFTVDVTSFTLPPGATQAVEVTVISQSVFTHRATLSIDHNGERSPTDVFALADARIAPQVVLDPISMQAAAMVDGNKQKILRVHNTGGSDLVFDALASNLSIQSTEQHEYVALSKNEVDTRPGILGSSGPDGFGYRWVDSDDPQGPAFNWVDIRQTGALLSTSGDDQMTAALQLGFEFPFYGQRFTALRVSTNGYVSFTDKNSDFANQPLANPGAPGNLLAALWDDLVVDSAQGSRLYTQKDEDRFVVQFTDLRRAGGTDLSYTFQIILSRDGGILYQYLELGPEVTSATVGIQNAQADNGLNVVFNEEYLRENLAVRLSMSPGWLSVSPQAGTVAAGEFITLQVSMDATGVLEGDHTGSVRIISNDPDEGEVQCPVVFHVGTVDAAETAADPPVIDPKFHDPWVVVRVVLPAGYQAEDVVLSTVRMQGHVPVDPSTVVIEITPPDAQVLKFKFERTSVIKLLPDADSVELVVTGEIRDTTFFEGRDTIELVRPRVLSPDGGEVFGGGSNVLVSWEIPSGWPVSHTDLYYTTDESQWSWTPLAEGVVGQTYEWHVPETQSETVKLRILVYGEEGLLGRDTSNEAFTISDAPTDAVSQVPSVHALLPNVPNPFNPMTSIRFDLPRDARVMLRIYNVKGKLVRNLVDEQVPAGRHEVTWDGRMNNGSRASSGVYFYRIHADAFTATRRMVLLK